MHIQVKSANGVSLVPMETRHFAARRIFIRGEISMESACAFADKLMLLCDSSADDPIDLYITSTGGDVRAGMLMYDAIQACSAPIRMFCQGIAYSMAAVIFASGRHGRFMMPHSELMLHEPLVSNAVHGNATSIRNLSQELLAVRSRLNRLLAHHTGKTEEEIEAASSYDHFFNAEESVAFGLADAIVNDTTTKEVDTDA